MKHRLNGEIQKLKNPYNGVNNPHLFSAKHLRGFGIEAFEEIYPELEENQRHTKEYVVDEKAFTITYGVEDIVYDLEAIYAQKESELHEVIKEVLIELNLSEQRNKGKLANATTPEAESTFQTKLSAVNQYRNGLVLKEQEERAEIRAHYESGDAQLLLAYRARTEEAEGIINQIKQL